MVGTSVVLGGGHDETGLRDVCAPDGQLGMYYRTLLIRLFFVNLRTGALWIYLNGY